MELVKRITWLLNQATCKMKLIGLLAVFISSICGCTTNRVTADVYYQQLKLNVGVFVIYPQEKRIVIFCNGITENDIEQFWGRAKRSYTVSILRIGSSVSELDQLPFGPLEKIKMEDESFIYRYKNRSSDKGGLNLTGNDMFWDISEISYLDVYVRNRIIQSLKVRFLRPD